MTRSIFITTSMILFLLITSGVATSQDFLLRENDPEVLAASRENSAVVNVFSDTNRDGVPDTAIINGVTISRPLRLDDAEGFRYEDGRSIVLYPSDFMGPLPAVGTSELLGFIHYFDEGNISTYLAIVAEQAIGDDTTKGLGVYFYDSSGLRVGAPTTLFMEKARLRSVPIYQQWVELGKDFGIGSNPVNSQFFVLAKDLKLQDDILIIMFQLYQ